MEVRAAVALGLVHDGEIDPGRGDLLSLASPIAATKCPFHSLNEIKIKPCQIFAGCPCDSLNRARFDYLCGVSLGISGECVVLRLR